MFIRTLLQRPFQQEFRGALGTRSSIRNYGKEKRCALPAGTTCQSQLIGVEEASGSPWEHAEVAKRRSEGAEQEGGAGRSAGSRESENKNKRKERKSQFRKRERNKLETKSAGKALEEPTGAPREFRLQRKEAAEGRRNKN